MCASNTAKPLQRSAFNSTHEPTAPVSRSRFRLRARRYNCQKSKGHLCFCELFGKPFSKHHRTGLLRCLSDKRVALGIRGTPAQPNRTEKITHGPFIGCQPVILRKLCG